MRAWNRPSRSHCCPLLVLTALEKGSNHLCAYRSVLRNPSSSARCEGLSWVLTPRCTETSSGWNCETGVLWPCGPVASSFVETWEQVKAKDPPVEGVTGRNLDTRSACPGEGVRGGQSAGSQLAEVQEPGAAVGHRALVPGKEAFVR